VSRGNEIEKDWEGCLSVPSIRGLVSRNKNISVRYFDRYGSEHNDELTGFLARIFQHELDHLDGLTFVDRVETGKDLFSEEEWRKQFLNAT